MRTPAARMPPDRSGAAQPDGAHPDGASSGTAQTDTTRADTAQSDTARSGTAQSGTAQSDTAQADTAQADTARLAAELAAERNVTLELQRAILPLHEGPFDLPGLRAVVRYLPASQDSRVGGDWYITAEMPGGHVLLAIGDVAGHGLAAAAGMARLRGALAGLAITGSPPERLVGWLNDLVHHVGPEHTASVVAGYFDPLSRVLTWAQAGHPPPVLVRGPRATALRQPAGILLGAARSGYEATSLELFPGDQILLYSDGLIERRHRSLDEGLAALTTAAAGITGPEDMISAVLNTLGSTDTEDDTCLVALYVR
jgi:serine phosphatase RsbU (regulator of sigma subunit)